MDLNDAIRIATAFDRFEDLVTTCYAGYIPTLRVSPADDLPTRVAKTMLARELKRRALRVAL